MSNNSTILKGTYGATSQTIFVADLISEGPIKGLVAGESSIYLNNIPLVEEAKATYSPSPTGTVTFTNSNTGILSEPLTADITVGEESSRYLYLYNYEVVRNITGALDLSPDPDRAPRITLTHSSIDLSQYVTYDNNTLYARLASPDNNVFLLGEVVVEESIAYFLGRSIFFPGQGNRYNLDDYALYIDKRIELTNINKTANPQELTVVEAPKNGEYTFFIGPELSNPPGDPRASEDIQRVGKTNVQFRRGEKTQEPMRDAGNVGGSPSIAGNIASAIPLRQCETVNLPEDIVLPGGNIFTQSGYPVGEVADGTVVEISEGPGGFNLGPDQIKEVDALRILINYPSLIAISEEDGKKYPASAMYDISIQTRNGSDTRPYQQLFGGFVLHTAEKQSPIAFEHTIDLEPFKPFTNFTLRITRLSRDRGTAVRESGVDYPEQDKATTTASISSIFSIFNERFIYPYTAYAGISFSSKDYSGLPQRTYECYGLEVKIPDTYSTREALGEKQARYDGFWTGTFKTLPEYTDNPAWVYYDILTNNRYGAGQWINEFDINKYALYRIARYCDELVDNGTGLSGLDGLEPRFRANIYLTKATDIYKVLKDMATIFTGMLYYLEGQVTPIIDAPADPIYTFSKGNVVDGAFSYETTGTKTRPNQIVVTWNNPVNNYQQEALIVEDANAILKTGRILTEEAFAFGTTSPGQATRYGRWKLYTSQFQTEIVSFSTALQGGFLQPGDIINIQDADRYGVSLSGRLKSGATTTTLNLDRTLTLRADSTYEVSVLITEPAAYVAQDTAIISGVTYSKGDRILGINTEEAASNIFDGGGDLVAVTWKPYTYTETRTVTTASGTVNSLTVSSAFSAIPAANTIWALKEFTLDGVPTVNTTKMYRILVIGEESKNIYRISAVEHYNEKYDAIEKDYALATLPDTVVSPNVVPAPINLRLIPTDNRELQVLWDAPPGYGGVAYYDLVYIVGGVEYREQVDTDVRTYILTNASNKIYTVRVRAVSTLNNNVSDWTSATITVQSLLGDGPGGMPRGALCNSSAFIDNNNSYRFEKVDYTIAPSQTAFDPFLNTDTGNSLSYSQDISGLGLYDSANAISRLVTARYIYFDRNNADKLKLVGWDALTFRDPALYYWYDAGNGSQVPTFYNLSGTATISENSINVSGTGTSFTTELDIGDVIQIATGKAAVVAAIISNTLLKLDRSFPISYTGITLKTTTLQLNLDTDCLIGKVYYDGINYFLENYLTLDPNLDQLARYVNVDSNIQFINYSAEETQETTYTDITLNITASGFTTPEFKVTGTGFSGVTGAADADYVSATSPNTYTRLINSNADVAYSGGSALEFIVDVREGNDPTNVNKQRSTTFRIGKVIGGSEGQNARAVSLTATDYSVVYDQNGANPSYEGTSPNIILTATAQGFSNPVYKFTGDGIVDQTVYDVANTINFPVPSSYFSSPQVLRVSVAENGINTEEAFDNISITGVKPGAEGYTVILTNEAHTLPANTSGGVTSFAGSGSLIEVFKGGTQLQYITSGTPTLGEFSVLVSSNTGMSAPVITVSGLNASIADFTSMTDDTETVTYTINVENISTTIQKKQSFSKSKEGAIGDTGPIGNPGTIGNTGFMYFIQNNTSPPVVGTIPTGTYEAGQIAIVQNLSNTQAGFRFDGTTWQPQTIVNSDIIFANAIKSQQLQISSDASSGARMFFNGDDNRIEIYDSAGNPRVVLGNLTGI